jgi:hypothetical protein
MSSEQSSKVPLYVSNKSQPLRLKAYVFCINDATQNVLATLIWKELRKAIVDQGWVNDLECHPMNKTWNQSLTQRAIEQQKLKWRKNFNKNVC